MPCWPCRGYLNFDWIATGGRDRGDTRNFLQSWYRYIKYESIFLSLYCLLTLSVRACCAFAPSSFLLGPTSWPPTGPSLLEFQHPGASTLHSDIDTRNSTLQICAIARRVCHLSKPADPPGNNPSIGPQSPEIYQPVKGYLGQRAASQSRTGNNISAISCHRPQCEH